MNFPLFNFHFSLKHTLPLVLLSFLMACNGNKQKNTDNSAATDTATAADSTLYGICGVGTAMHTLQLITLTGDTLNLSLLPDDDDDADTRATVNGGLMCGDHLAVLATTTADGPIATKVVNLTSLMGRWTSISRNFVIE